MEALKGTTLSSPQYIHPRGDPGVVVTRDPHSLASRMERARYLAHRGKRILYVDYSGIRTVEELEGAARQATSMVQAEPPNSVLALLDLNGVPFGLRLVRMLGEAAAANVDFVRARAVVGLPETERPTLGAVADFTGRPLEAFQSTEAALDWLVSHAPEEPESDRR